MSELGQHRARLAEAFDLGFASPILDERPEVRDYLVLRFGAQRYAVPVGELAGVQNKGTLQYLPDAPPHCVGLTALRGRAGAVYDLGGLLGAPASDRPSFLLQTRRDPEIALLAPKPECYLRAAVDRVVPCAEDAGPSIGALAHEEAAINVISVELLVATIRSRSGGGGA